MPTARNQTHMHRATTKLPQPKQAQAVSCPTGKRMAGAEGCLDFVLIMRAAAAAACSSSGMPPAQL